MSLSPLFTVIMPIYNVRAYLDRGIKSVLNQSYAHFQLILVDDGSTDGSGERLDYWAKCDTRIEVYHQPNGGVSAARNTGILHARGEYLTFVDGDDWAEHDYLEFMVQAFQKHQVQMVCCGFYIDPKGQLAAPKVEAGLLTRKEMINRILKLNGSVRGYTWNKAYQLALIKEHQFKFDTDVNLMEDQLFNICYVNDCEQIYFDTKALYHYVQRSDSIIHGFSAQNFAATFIVNYRILRELNRKRLSNQEDTDII